MGQSQFGNEGSPESRPPIRELRRMYHDRIADVRERSLVVLRGSIGAAAAATHGLVDGECEGSPAAGDLGGDRLDADAMQALVSEVDEEVVALLALESPVARDLRVILASRDVTQLGLLCFGLGMALAERVDRAARALTPDLRRLVGRTGATTVTLLRSAEAAWATLDPPLATDVVEGVAGVRALQRELLSGMIGLVGVPMDSALDLAMVARAFERLADHAVEVAERVLFAVKGTATQLSDIDGLG